MFKRFAAFVFCVWSSCAFPDELAPPQRVRRSEVIFIDPGHGGKDQGSASKELHYEEKSLALSLSLYVQSYLKRMGYKPMLTRSSDVYIDLTKRAALANQGKADVFVSIHCNYSSNSEACGTEVYFYKGKSSSLSRSCRSEALGEDVLAAMKRNGALKIRGTRAGNFAVIRETAMPAILIETGFLSNPRERAALLDARYRMHLAKGIAEGIHSFLSKRQKPDSNNVKSRKVSAKT